MAVNKRRVFLGAAIGGVVWTAWSFFINAVLLGRYYTAAQAEDKLLPHSRYPLFLGYWIITLFVLSYILVWMYVSMRVTLGPGFLTAFRVGFLGGFVAGFPISLSLAAWAPFSRVISLGWMLDLWVGAILSTVVSAWLYKEQP
jgi:hypothetical protein